MISVGIIGAGSWGRNIVRAFRSLSGVRVAYVADVNPAVLDDQDDGVCTITGDYTDILADDSIDAVVIATPPVTHAGIIREALNAGKHVFVEKPMTLDPSAARECVALAGERDRLLMVGHLMLYHPCVNEIRRLLGAGEIGDIFYLYSQRLNLGKVRSDENALLSFAPHDISLANYLIGDYPLNVSATGRSYLQDGIEDVAFLTLTYPGGVMANVHVSWLDPHKIRRTTVVGSKKMIVFDDMEPREKIRIYDKGVEKSGDYGSYGEFLSLRDGNIYIPAVKMSEPLALECRHFIDCIVNGETPRSDGYNGLKVTQILDAAMRSLSGGGVPVPVGE